MDDSTTSKPFEHGPQLRQPENEYDARQIEAFRRSWLLIEQLVRNAGHDVFDVLDPVLSYFNAEEAAAERRRFLTIGRQLVRFGHHQAWHEVYLAATEQERLDYLSLESGRPYQPGDEYRLLFGDDWTHHAPSGTAAPSEEPVNDQEAVPGTAQTGGGAAPAAGWGAHAVDGERTGYERLDKYATPPRQAAAEVLTSHANGQPWVVRFGERLFTEDHDQQHVRRVVERVRCERVIHALGGPDALLAHRRTWGLDFQEAQERTAQLIKKVGEFLHEQGRNDLWKLLYLELRADEEGLARDPILKKLPLFSYQEGDEFRFLWGDVWRDTLDSGLQTQHEEAELRSGLDADDGPAAPPAPRDEAAR